MKGNESYFKNSLILSTFNLPTTASACMNPPEVPILFHSSVSPLKPRGQMAWLGEGSVKDHLGTKTLRSNPASC